MGIFKTIYHLNSNTKQCSVEKGHKQKLGSRKNSMMYRTIALTIGNFYTQKVKWSLCIIWSQLDLKIAVKRYLPILAKTFKKLSIFKMNECLSSC